MNSTFSVRFLKDAAKLPDAATKSAVADTIELVEAAERVTDIPNLKKLKGFKNAYRLRIGVFITQNTVEFVRVIHRRDIYRLFP